MLNVNRPSARLIGGSLVAVMVLGSALGAEAATKKKAKHKAVVKTTRTVTLKYSGPCGLDTPAILGGFGDTCTPYGAAGWVLQAKPTEKFVSISVKDSSGSQVPGDFWEKGGGTANDTAIPFCGAMKDYTVPSGGSIQLDLPVNVAAKCPGFPTQGTVTLVFSNLP